MKKDKNTVALYVDKSTVNIYKASLDLYEALKAVKECGELSDQNVVGRVFEALAKAEEV